MVKVPAGYIPNGEKIQRQVQPTYRVFHDLWKLLQEVIS
jgi:hypothetical protein